jgi:hypothetical protein
MLLLTSFLDKERKETEEARGEQPPVAAYDSKARSAFMSMSTLMRTRTRMTMTTTAATR